MQTPLETLPTTRDELVALITQRDQLLGEQEQKIDALTARLNFFEEQFRLLRQKQFARRCSRQRVLSYGSVFVHVTTDA